MEGGVGGDSGDSGAGGAFGAGGAGGVVVVASLLISSRSELRSGGAAVTRETIVKEMRNNMVKD